MVKRITDIVLSILFILLLLPLCIIISIAIILNDRGKIFYLSQRIGLNGRLFNMYKFRTMSHNRTCITKEQLEEFQHNFKIKNDGRVTKVGIWLRKHSLDEIPQFLNVLKGDMSILGPRPKLPDEVELFGNSKNEILSVLPGITGYWQVHRKNASSDKIMREMDLYYIRNRTLAMDVRIFLMTFFIIIAKKNY